jgi:predicted RNA-binding Zn ribbon-like protein
MSRSPAGNLSLVGGSLALDFANTASGRGTPAPVERLEEPLHVAEFAAHAEAVDVGTARRVREVLADDPVGAGVLLRRARQLREAIYDIGAAIAHAKPPPDGDLAVLKTYAQKAMAAGVLAPAEHGGYRLDFASAPVEEAVLGPIAWSAVALLADLQPARLKQCPGDGCGFLFLDLSKNASRRWCDMATCGNRHKGRRHRERR